MITINLNTYEGIDVILFPDGQPHITLNPIIGYGEIVRVVASLTNSNRVIQLLEIASALDVVGAQKFQLYIPYLMGARYDRVMKEGDSFDLKVIANLINSMGFSQVYLLDPHSDVAPALINNSHVITNQFLVEKYEQKDAVLIVPDAGAAKKANNYMEWNKNIVDTVHCIKHRNTTTGNIYLKVLEPEKCEDRNCVIIDDICDGGATFIAIGEQIRAEHNTLIVTHGIFSKGFRALEDKFREIITSTSYSEDESQPFIKRYKSPIE